MIYIFCMNGIKCFFHTFYISKCVIRIILAFYNNSYYASGKAQGCTIYDLGTGSSFNVSNIQGINYSILTSNNFIIEVVSGSTGRSESGHVDNYDCGAMVKGNVNKSYNASTGVLSAYVSAEGGYYTNNNSSFSRSAGVSYTVKAYLVIGEIN